MPLYFLYTVVQKKVKNDQKFTSRGFHLKFAGSTKPSPTSGPTEQRLSSSTTFSSYDVWFLPLTRFFFSNLKSIMKLTAFALGYGGG